jgi:hypothetical protein
MPYTTKALKEKMNLQSFLQTSFQNVRSSRRTDKLNQIILDEILNSNPELAEYDWKFEHRLLEDGFKGTFDIDIAGFLNGELKVAILNKALNSNINKNIKNYSNTSIGESARLMYAPNVNFENIMFVTILPRNAPVFLASGKVKTVEDVVKAKKKTQISEVLHNQYNGVVKVIDLYYDIKDIKSKQTKDDFNDIIVENLDEIKI